MNIRIRANRQVYSELNETVVWEYTGQSVVLDLTECEQVEVTQDKINAIGSLLMPGCLYTWNHIHKSEEF